MTIAALPCRAQADRPVDLLAQYRASELVLDFGFFTGLQVTRAGADANPGFFGGDAALVFEGSPGALEDMDTYRSLRISGMALWAAGLGMLVSEIVLLLVDSETMIDPDSGGTPLFYGLLGGGAALGLVGGGLIGGANSYLSSAVQQYNTDLEERLRRQAGAAGQLRLLVTQHF